MQDKAGGGRVAKAFWGKQATLRLWDILIWPKTSKQWVNKPVNEQEKSQCSQQEMAQLAQNKTAVCSTFTFHFKDALTKEGSRIPAD